MAKRLQAFEKPAKDRADQGEFWWELRACAYYDEFEKPKIFFQEICTYQAFTYDRTGTYCNNKLFMIPDINLFLLGLINTKLIWFFLNFVAPKLQGGALALQGIYMSQIPVPKFNESQSKAIERLTNQILTAKATDPTADTSAWEAEIDRLVYALYGLTDAEIALVEERQGG